MDGAIGRNIQAATVSIAASSLAISARACADRIHAGG
jgi:hypothetical protein